nr:MAG TPA: hypothetical protein [Caudoviricetes sp.]
MRNRLKCDLMLHVALRRHDGISIKSKGAPRRCSES